MRAVLLLNESEHVESWEFEALELALADGLQLDLVAHCTNSPARSLSVKTAAYYGLAAASRMGMKTTPRRHLGRLLRAQTPRLRFAADHEGAWQRIPDAVAAEFVGADVVIKFGMTLLRGADDLPVRYGVLSYHHGDPSHYRGRPAGYYELRNGERTQGVIVQKLSDTLDGGLVLAQARSQVVPHSYGQTLAAAHRAGVPLLRDALRNLQTGRIPSQPLTLGPNFRLPVTGDVLRQACRLGVRKARRVKYGAIVEKRWKIGWHFREPSFDGDSVIDIKEVEPLPLPHGFSFAADPMLGPDGSVYAELMNKVTGRGEVQRFQKGAWHSIDLGIDGHASYPQVVTAGSEVFLFPEIATFAPPTLFKLSPDSTRVVERTVLKGLEDARLVDATLFQKGGTWYLFAGQDGSAGAQLNLWHGPDVRGPYALHPASPICVDPQGARMAGPIATADDVAYRFGQDGTANYGGRIRTHRIQQLTRDTYVESVCGTISCLGHWGPHTINMCAGRILIDYYDEKATPVAGVRRLRGFVAARRTRLRK